MPSGRGTWTAALLRGWRAAAVVLANVVLVVVVLNLILAHWFPAPAPPRPGAITGPLADYVRQEFLARRSFESIERFFPGMSSADVVELVVETYARPFVYEPFTTFTERPFHSRFVNVEPQGFRRVPNQAPWPPAKGRKTVFVFGGSTTFGAGVPDDATIPSQLSPLLEHTDLPADRQLYNFGRGHYFSTQERILFEQLLAAGHVPDVAIFIDGLNEFTHADGLPAHTAELAQFLEAPLARCPAPVRGAVDAMPITRAANALGAKLAKPAPASTWRPPALTPAQVTEVLERYLANVRIAQAVADAYGVKALFVWQPVPTYKYDLRYHLFYKPGPTEPPPGCAPGYEQMAEWRRAGKLPASLWWCADIQEQLHRPLYVDQVHYTPTMSRRVAGCVAKGLVGMKLVGRRPS